MKKFQTELVLEKERTEHLLMNLLPKSIAQQLKEDFSVQDHPIVAEAYKEVTILFADIVQFTKMSSNTRPGVLVQCTTTLFLLSHVYSGSNFEHTH